MIKSRTTYKLLVASLLTTTQFLISPYPTEAIGYITLPVPDPYMTFYPDDKDEKMNIQPSTTNRRGESQSDLDHTIITNTRNMNHHHGYGDDETMKKRDTLMGKGAFSVVNSSLENVVVNILEASAAVERESVVSFPKK